MKKKKNKFTIAPPYIILLSIVVIGLILRLFQLQTHMMFIGDFAWFYLSAEKMITTGEIPLVGITTSQTWLHQGALWTYILAPVLWLFSLSPLSGAYIAVLLGVITMYYVFRTGTELFNYKIGLIAAFLFATSPLVIFFSRLPYHTSPIPLFSVLLILFSHRWIKQGWKYFPHVIFCTVVLYNFELATVVVVPALLVLGYFVYSAHGLRKFFSLKIIIFSFLGFVLPMIPILLYDLQNGFLQTIKFAHWSIYLRVIKPLFTSGETHINLFESHKFYFENFQKLIFIHNPFVAFLVLIIIVSFLALKLLMQKKFSDSEKVVWMFLLIPFGLFIMNNTESDAYLPLLFPQLILIVSFVLWQLFEKKILFLVTLLMVFGAINSFTLIKKNYLMEIPNGYGVTYEKRLDAVERIARVARSSRVALNPSQKNISNFTLPYEFMLHRRGIVVDQKSSEVFEIFELLDRVHVQYNNIE